MDRPVEPELVGDPVEILGAHGGAERVNGRRPARRQMEEGEPGERHQAEHHDRLDHPPREVLFQAFHPHSCMFQLFVSVLLLGV